MSDWEKTQQDFRAKVLLHRRHVPMREIAEAIHADRDTVYRLFRGEVKRPCRAVRENVEAYVSDLRQPERNGEDE